MPRQRLRFKIVPKESVRLHVPPWPVF
jgi:hypothetical protein